MVSEDMATNRLSRPALLFAAAMTLAPVTAAHAALVTARAYQPARIDRAVRRNGQAPRSVAPDANRASPLGNPQADRAWTDIMVRPCVKSGNRVVC